MSSQIRNFVLAFVIAAVVFSGIAFVAVQIIDTVVLNPEGSKGVNPETVTPPAPPPETNEDGNNPVYLGSGTTFNFLLIGTDYENLSGGTVSNGGVLRPENKHCAKTIVLGMFHKEKNEFVYMVVPASTVINVEGVEMKISEAYHYKGDKFIADKVSVMMGIAVDYYMTIEMSDLIPLVDYVGGVSCNLPEDVTYYDPVQKINFNLKKGTSTMTGSQVVGALRYDGYQNEMQKVTFAGDAFVAVIKALTSNYLNKQKHADVYAFYTQNMNTNFTFKAFDDNIDLIFKFTSMKVSKIVYPGYWEEKGFVPETKKGNEYFSVYR